MASPNSSFTDIITTTLQGYSGEMADNITNHNALLRWINKKGNKRTATGRTIVQELEYAENATTQPVWAASVQAAADRAVRCLTCCSRTLTAHSS